jgi:hypothetical protein
MAGPSFVARQFWSVAALLPLIIHPACTPEDDGESRELLARSGSALYAQDDTLWSLKDGKAVVRVCWLPLDLAAGYFPDPPFAPNIGAALAEKKQWAREIVEKEWNGRTMMKFVGWKDCDAETGPTDIQLQPIVSRTTPSCATLHGNSCVDALGKKAKKAWLNLFFGEELESVVGLMVSKPETKSEVQQKWDIVADGGCRAEVLLAFNNPSSANLANFAAVHQRCVQRMILHEFGHAAGFAHEHNRPDDAARQAACVKFARDIGFIATLPDAADPGHGDHPLGQFDSESIMSYCRTNPLPVLSEEDVEQANAVYGALLPEREPDDAGSSPADVDSAPINASTKKPRPTTDSEPLPSSGGCLGG